ncbi:hypothetical protein C8Q70DRAFT_918343 [Cubamyces menziesii]|nr:hypothetical protein C8Q70DRAFT_926866 [Cubamyces menziesii]KAI0658219.1 hypothetical protein C8Q70DRAFT_918343 [Cubamyces menziesii]
MEEVRGVGRGSYIWGRSVHNIRIERLWADVTTGFGQKWKAFFRQLEASYGLDINSDAHLWLLHHLFLDVINRDAGQWAATWNSHIIARRGERHMTPHQMYVHGLAQRGQRGVLPADPTSGGDEPAHAAEEDFADYGIDWDDLDHPPIRNHHDEHNTNDGDRENPFVTNDPAHFSHVEVPDPRCPLAPQQVAALDAQLAQLPSFPCSNMQSCLELWIAALQIARAV